MPEYFAAIFQGLIEGLTEFVPVSSTGHLLLSSHFFNLAVDEKHTFEVFIQLGAVFAVLIYYYKTWIEILFHKQIFILKLAVAAFPALIAGALFYKQIKEFLFAPIPIAIALIIGGIFMLVIDREGEEQEITFKQALSIGLFQVLSLCPGVSRAGSTMLGGMLVGLPRRQAAKFSFLLSVPVISAAALYDIYKSYNELSTQQINLFAVGFISSLVFSLIAIGILMQLLKRYSLRVFGVYRIILGILVLVLLSSK